MPIEIIKDDIKLPEQRNLTWVFPVRLNGRDIVEWKVDSFDLNTWFKEALGRYPKHDRGDKDELLDVLENWPVLEPRLKAEAEKQVEFGVSISVAGFRTRASEWDAAKMVPKEELPPLTDAQRDAAKKMGVSEEDYARSFMAGEKTWNILLDRTRQLARVLQGVVREISPEAVVESVVLRTWEERFDVDIREGEKRIPVRIEEDIVRRLFEGGSAEAERSLRRVLDIALRSRIQ